MPGPNTGNMRTSTTNVLYHDDFPDSNILSPDRKTKKEKNRKSSIDQISPDTSKLTPDLKSEKKKKKKKERDTSSEEGLKIEKKKDKGSKRKAEESPASDKAAKLSKVELQSQSESEEGSEILNPYSVSNFRISEKLRQKLKDKGIEALFPIQALTFDGIFEGNDLVGRARTGQGKTLAFVLPILESLSLNESFRSTVRQYGRAPSVLVLVPTRELAKQVHADFENYGSAFGISTVCIYGGAPYGPQQNALRRGVDVVVGTPGRVKDHLQRGSLNLRTLKFRVLDEADEMLNMGFVDDVETILGYVEDANTVQTLLFSATMPDWVKKIASKFLKSSRETVDLVGDEKMKASSSVRHLLLPCMRSAKFQLIPDVVTCYSSGGRTIVFTETKSDASELASLLPDVARALHGDIAQAQREVTLAGFRSGKFSVLVATDVAARGLDINDVQLVVQCEPPRDVETYIHRSGRTGRAGKTGISVLFYDRSKEYMIPKIELKAGFKFERINAPHPADLAKSSFASAMEKILEVSDSVLPIFRVAADELLEKSDLSAADLLAKALARIAGHTNVKRRSLLSSHSDFVTLKLQSEKPLYTRTYAFNSLRRLLSDDTVEQVKGLSITADGLAAVFDVPSNSRETFLTAQTISNHDGLKIIEIDSLPELQTQQDPSSIGRRGGFGGRGNSPHSRFGQGGSNRGRGRGGFNRGGMGRGR